MNAHPLDGALLLFDRKSGWNVRIENESTRHLRRRAPRVVMFGITNACNLHYEVERNLVLVENLVRRKRLALRAYGYGARVDALESEDVMVHAWFRIARGKVDRAALARALEIPFPRAKLAPKAVEHAASVGIRTTTPAPVLATLDAMGRELGLEVSLWVEDTEPLDRAVARLLADLA